ncbi:MAG: hypothetical protein JJ992_19430, partial [Planctomycetes bacterium]|nr:hypothetical protein [Planctomycetota bacterium]
ALDQDAASIERTLAETNGDVVFVQTGHSALRPSVLRQLWAMEESKASSSASAPRERARLPGLPPRRPRSPSESSCTEVDGLRVIRRR